MNWERYHTDDPTISIVYDADRIDQLAGIELHVEDIIEAIDEEGSSLQYWIADDNFVICYDWSSDIEFEDHIGGGNMISICTGDTIILNDDPLIILSCEWYDSYAEEHGFDDCRDTIKHETEGLLQLNQFLATI